MSSRKQLILFTLLFIFVNSIGTLFYSLEIFNNFIITFSLTTFEIFFAMLGNMIILTLITLVIFLFAKRTTARMITMTVFSGIFSMMGFSLWMFTRFYQSPFSTRDLTFAKNAEGEFAFSFFKMMPEFLFREWRIVLFANFIILLVILIIYLTKKNKYKRQNVYGEKLSSKVWIQRPKTIFAGILLLILLSFAHINAGYQYAKKRWILNHDRSTYGIQVVGLYNYYLYDILGFTWAGPEQTKNVDYNQMFQYDKNVASYQNFFGETYSNNLTLDQASTVKLSPKLGPVESLNGIFKDKNIVYIQLETLNNFVLDGSSEIIESLNLLPNWHRLINESYFFENFYNVVGVGNSSDAEISGLTGLYPTGNRLNFWQFGNDEYELKTGWLERTLKTAYSEPIDFKLNPLPTALGDDYYAASYHGDNRFFYNREIVHPGMFQFDEFFHYSTRPGRDIKGVINATEAFPDHLEKLPDSPWVGEKDLFEWVKIKAKEKLANNEKYFMFPITIHAHTPFLYNPYEEEPALEKDDLNVTKSTLNFLNYLKYYNDIFQYVIDMANELTNTVYVLYTDHGAGLSPNELRNLFDNPDLTDLEGWRLINQLPALIYAPDDSSTGDMKEGLLKGRQPLVRSQVDLYRTILELVGRNEGHFYYGVNGLSDERTFALQTRISLLITDDFTMQLKKYVPNKRLSNKSIMYHNEVDYDIEKLVNDILNFKYTSDLMIHNNLIQEINKKKKGH